MPVKKGDKIKVEYEGKLEDGTVFDSSSKHGHPLEFEVGSGQLIPGFDNAVLGMDMGDEKEITLNPTEAYGEFNESLIRKFPKEQIPSEQELEVGMTLGVQLPNGAKLPAKVTEVSDSEVTIDLNHALAGKTLIFSIKVVELENSEKVEESVSDSSKEE